MQQGFRGLLDSAVFLQRNFRKRRWIRLMGNGIPIIRGPCGYAILPVYSSELELLGVVGEVREYKSTSMGCLRPTSHLRLAAIAIIEWVWFDRLTLVVVLLNCIDLAILGPPDLPHAHYHDVFEEVTTWYFTIELFLKVIAMGFAGHGDAYLGDAWNQLDFVVVLTAWLPLLFPTLDNFSAMRAVRALRPLRTINRLPELKAEVETLMISLPQLFDVVMLSAFIMVVFGVLGVQLFAGMLLSRCYEVGTTEPIDADGDSAHGVCSVWSLDDTQGTCGVGQECRFFGTNPLSGTVSFDTIGGAFMTIFQCVTLEGWSDIMYMTLRAAGPVAGVYCIMLVILGSFYVLNLFLAVMWAVNNRPPPRQPRPKKKKKLAGAPEAAPAPAPTAASTPALEADNVPLLDEKQRSLAMKSSAAVSFHLPKTDEEEPEPEVPVDAVPALPPLSQRSSTLMERFVNASFFQTFVIFLILGSTFLMTLKRYPASEEFNDALEDANLIFTLLFTLEMLLKHCAFGFRDYWSEPFNRFDGIIVSLSLVDVISEFVKILPADSPAFNAFRAFRLFRVFRIFRLIRSWTGLRELLAALLNSLAALFYLMLLFALFLFIYALLGMQLFGEHYQPPAFEEPPRANFNSITFSMITVFIVATSEGWNSVWLDTVRAVGSWSEPYFLTLVVLLNFIMLNLVVATLIGTFDKQAAEERKKRAQREQEEMELDEKFEENTARDAAAAAQAVASFYGRRASLIADPAAAQAAAEAAQAAAAAAGASIHVELSAANELATAAGRDSPSQIAEVGAAELEPVVIEIAEVPVAAAAEDAALPPRLAAGLDADAASSPSAEPSFPPSAAEVSAQEAAPLVSPPASPPEASYAALIEEDARHDIEGGALPPSKEETIDPSDLALCLFGPRHCVRRAAHALVDFQLGSSALSFDNVIVAFILLSSVAMAFNSCDLDPQSELAAQLALIDLVAIGVFVTEMVAKVLANGLLFTPNAYLKDGWNRLDFLIVGTSLLSLVGGSSPGVRVLRVLRVLRPLRLISRSSGMRTAIQLLLRAMPRVLDVAVVFVLFLVVFSILGVQLFAGTFGSCHSADVSDELLVEAGTHHGLDKAECDASAGMRWHNPARGNFDSTPSSMLLLFEMSTLEGWLGVMFTAIDATGVGTAPVRDAHPENALFFILWIVLGSMLLLNLFVGVLVNVFGDIKRQEEEGGGDTVVLMTDEQRQWTESMESALELRPTRVPKTPTNPIRRACFEAVRMKQFETLILGVILFNTLLMALDGYNTPPVEAATLVVLNNVCTSIFIVEALMKITAVGCPTYLADGWNVFDFGVVLISIADWVVTWLAAELGSTTNPTLIRVLRMVRITRVLRTIRMVRSATSLRLLLSMLLLSLPALSNILGIYLIMLSMYSLLAMQLFGQIAYGEYINEDANFCTFGRAALTLFRCSTGESWNGLMHDAMIQPESGLCSYEDGNCGNTFVAVPFFVSYVLLSTFIVLKMMIVLILENYLKTLKRDRSSVKPEDAEAFIEAWSKYDPEGRGLIPANHLIDLVRSLRPPLGLNPSSYPGGVLKRVHVQRYVFKLQVRPIANEFGQPEVPFKQLLACMVRDAYFEKGSRVRLVRSWTDIFANDSIKESATGKRLVAKMMEHDIVDEELTTLRAPDRAASPPPYRDGSPTQESPAGVGSLLSATSVPIGEACAMGMIIKSLRAKRLARALAATAQENKRRELKEKERIAKEEKSAAAAAEKAAREEAKRAREEANKAGAKAGAKASAKTTRPAGPAGTKPSGPGQKGGAPPTRAAKTERPSLNRAPPGGPGQRGSPAAAPAAATGAKRSPPSKPAAQLAGQEPRPSSALAEARAHSKLLTPQPKLSAAAHTERQVEKEFSWRRAFGFGGSKPAEEPPPPLPAEPTPPTPAETAVRPAPSRPVGGAKRPAKTTRC